MSVRSAGRPLMPRNPPVWVIGCCCGIILGLPLDQPLAQVPPAALPASPLVTRLTATGTIGSQRIAAGANESLAIKPDGSLWAWGGNPDGQLGDDTTITRERPVQVLSGVAAVAAGKHSLAIATDASLWAWGLNSAGQLGDGTLITRWSPIQVLTEVTAVAAGYYHTLAIKTDGNLWAWGDNQYGQLGDGTQTPSLSPVQVLTAVAAVAAAERNTLAIKTDGTLWGWGRNASGQLGDGTKTARRSPVPILAAAAAVAAGDAHTLAIKTDGSLWAWGDNWYGELGDGGTATTQLSPLQVLTGVAAVAAGDHHSLAITSDGTLWAWGANGSGQLGDGTTIDRARPVQVLSAVAAVAAGNAHSLARKTDGSLWAWGQNDAGQLGDGTQTNRSRPTPVPGFSASTPDFAVTNSALTPPDFVVTGIVLTPSGPRANHTFNAAVTVKNQGTQPGAPGTLQIWTDQATTPDCAAVGDQSANPKTLAAGASRTVTFHDLPTGAAGIKTLRAFVDSACRAPESDGTNNQLTYTYTVFGRRIPDFVVTDITLTPEQPSANGTFSAVITVKDQGSGGGDGSYLDVWTDQAAEQTCPAEGDANVSIGIVSAGATKTITVPDLPAGAAGTKTLRAFVDSYCRTTESYEDNNQAIKGYTVGP